MRAPSLMIAVTLIAAGSAFSNGPRLQRPVSDAALYTAIKAGDASTVKEALHQGTSPDAIGPDGSSILLQAVAAGHVEVVKILLAAGANPKTEGNGPLAAVAARGNDMEVLRCLVEAGVILDPPKRPATWDNAVVASVVNGNPEMLAYLLAHGASPDGSGFAGVTGLQLAAAKEDIEVMRLLLDSGASVNKADHYGRTALMFACREGKRKAVECLLSKGADSSLRDGYDRDAKQLAREAGHDDLTDSCSGKAK